MAFLPGHRKQLPGQIANHRALALRIVFRLDDAPDVVVEAQPPQGERVPLLACVWSRLAHVS